MRRAVSKPIKTTKLIKNLNTPIDQLARPEQIKTPTLVGKINPRVARRATTYRPSEQISRFGAPIKSTERPVFSNNIQSAQTTSSPANPLKKDVFSQAINKANSHQQPRLTKKELKAIHGKKRPTKNKWVAYLSVGVLVLAIAGYGVYQNIPNIMAKVASIQAGFAANLPSYRPSGFSLSTVGYQPGTVDFNFKSNIDNRKYTISEHSSNWDSETLVSSIVIPTQGTNFKKIMVDGQSIFLYGHNEASWVTNGIWYQVQGDGSLSTNQLIKLAAKL
jgi:hypothetical protein